MEFANDISLQLKRSQELGIPKKFLVGNENIIPKILGLIDTGKTLIELYQIFETIMPQDLAMLYAKKEIYTFGNYQKPEEKNIDKKFLLQKINEFYTLLKLDKILDTNELILLIEDWDKKFRNLVEKDREEYDRILIVEEEMAKYEPLERSPLKIESTILIANMQFKDGKNLVNPEDGYEVFDLTVPNRVVPYVKWRTNLIDIDIPELIKIYKGERNEDMPDFNKILQSANQKELLNTIYLTVQKSDSLEGRDAFIKANYNISKNELRLKLPIDDSAQRNGKDDSAQRNGKDDSAQRNGKDDSAQRNGKDDDGKHTKDNDGKSDKTDKYNLLQKIVNVLPLETKNVDEKSVSGEVYVYDINVNLLLLSHMILNDELFRNYLFQKEMSNTAVYTTKNTLKIFFRSTGSFLSSDEEEDDSASVSFYINQLFSHGNENIEILKKGLGVGERNLQTYKKGAEILSERKLGLGVPYVQIKISSAASVDVAEQFIGILTRLLTRYKEEQGKIEKLYLSYIPEFLEYKTLDVTSKGRKDAATKISQLKQVAPDLFIADYARKCLCQFQPIPIDDDEVEAWRNKTFTYQGRERKREVLSFPPNNPRWNFVCPDDKYPFPGVKTNKLSNRDLYPGLPCCFVKEQIGSAKSNYEKLYGKGKDEEFEREEDVEREDEDVEREEVEREEGEREEEVEFEREDVEREEGEREEEVEFEREGVEFEREEESENEEQEMEIPESQEMEIPESQEKQEKFESHMIKTDKIINVDRYGIVPNSITELFGEERKMRRKGVPRSINSLLHAVSIAVKDKNYMAAKDKERYVALMRQSIANVTKPGLLKQELYDFKYEDITRRLKSNEFLDPNLYFRAIEDAYKINIFVFAPSLNEEKRLRDKEESVGAICLPRYKLFSARAPRFDRMSICIYRTMGSESDILTYPQCELLVFTQDGEEITLFDEEVTENLFTALTEINKIISWELVNDKGIDVVAHENLYSRLDYFNLTKRKAFAQYIDEYGKMRGLYLDKNILMIFTSSQPENLAVRSDLTRADHHDVISLFGNPIAISARRAGVIDGFWYSVLDLTYGIYVPIIEIEIKDEWLDMEIGPNNPLGESNGKDKAKRLVKLKRDLDFILQIFKWFISISRLNVDALLQRHVMVGEEENGVDSAEIYDFSRIGRKFPEAKDLEEAIEKMEERAPSLFRKNRIYIYSQKMLEGVQYLLNMYVKEYSKDLVIVPKSIKRKYLTTEDFIVYQGVALFFSQKEMGIWLEDFKKSYEILKSISIQNAIHGDPFFYSSSDGHIYLIQNVTEGDIQRALNVGYYWNKYRVNPGFRSPPYSEDEILKYVIYSISPANTIVPYENRAGSDLNYISILRYNDFSFACMIVIL
jgi:hypothetical protein